MSIRDERSGVEFAGGRGASGVFAQPRRSARSPLHVGPGADQAIPDAGRRVLEADRRRAIRPTYGEFLRAHRLLGRVRAAVRGAARVVRVVDGHRRRVGLPRPVPVPLPRPPRPARVVRLAAVVHRGRRLTHVRRRDRRPAARRARRPRGGERAAPRHRGLGAEPLRNVEPNTTRSSSPPMPTRRSTCWPMPAARRRRSSGRSATPAARPSCTPMPGCSRPHRGPGRRGTTSRRRHRTAITPRS